MRRFAYKQGQSPALSPRSSSPLRRPGPLAAEPDRPEHPHLRLHRAIGNRAMQRLVQTHGARGLFQPLVQRQKGSDAGTGDKREPSATPQKTDAFKKAGIDSPRHYLEDDAPELLVAVLSQSNLVKSYLKRSPQVITKNFIKHGSDEEFEHDFVEINKVKAGSEEMKEMATVRGFFDPKKDAIHLRPRANYGEALHEAMHKLSDPRFRAIFGHRPVDEGITQYFTDRVLEEQGLPAAKTAYNLDCANDLFAIAGFDAVARMYFQGEDKSRNDLMIKMNVSTDEFLKLGGKSPEWCERFKKARKEAKKT